MAKKKKKSTSIHLWLTTSLLSIIVFTATLFLWSFNSNSFSFVSETLNPEIEATRNILKKASHPVEYYSKINSQYPRDLATLENHNLIQKIPQDQHGNTLKYQRDIDNGGYRLKSSGKDRVLGTSDDVCLRSIYNNGTPLHFYSCNM